MARSYLSSPIGLGHARRDLAITRELRALHPDIQVDWLAQDPVTRFLDANNETIHPDSLKAVDHLFGLSFEVLCDHWLSARPAFIVIKAANEFKDKTTAINQLSFSGI